MFNDFVNQSVECVCNDKVNVVPYIGVAPGRYLYVYSPEQDKRKLLRMFVDIKHKMEQKYDNFRKLSDAVSP